MNLLIAGSRSIDAFDFAEHIPPETDLIISGGLLPPGNMKRDGFVSRADRKRSAGSVRSRRKRPRADGGSFAAICTVQKPSIK